MAVAPGAIRHTHRSAELQFRAFSSHNHRAKLELCAPVMRMHSDLVPVPSYARSHPNLYD
jgi:hypothetical protein